MESDPELPTRTLPPLVVLPSASVPKPNCTDLFFCGSPLSGKLVVATVPEEDVDQ